MSLLPKGYLDAVVSIELSKGDNNFQAIATGFLVGFLSGEKNEHGDSLFRIFLVTNKHVFNNKKEVWLRFNKGLGSTRYKIDLVNENNGKIWSMHTDSNVDVAVIPINANKLKEDGIEFAWIPDNLMAFSDIIKTLGITQGDDVFVLGFPMGLTGKEKNYVIVRGGVIARLDEEIIDTTKTFLIDSFVFPGNSGGPVILKPTIVSIEGTKPINKAYVIGIINGYKPYEEIAYSLQTDPPEPRIKFIENSGLASVVPLDYVREIISSLMPEKKPTEEEKKQMAIEEKELPTVEGK